jgi:branched-chain amino acid transport system substrate-binding protein
MSKKVFITLGVIAVIVIGVFVWLTNSSPKQETINVGVILPLSGDGAVYGKSIQNGIDFALAEVDSTNLTVKLIYEDSKFDPKLAVNAFQKLSTINGCKIILGGFSSSDVLSIAPIAQKNKVVLISPTATSPAITHAGDYIFRITPSDIFDGEVMAKFAFNELNLRNIAVIFLNNDYGQGILKVFREKFIEFGGKITAERSFEAGTNNFKSQLTALKQSTPDGLFIVAAAEIGTILKQKAELNMDDIKQFSTGLAENPMVLEIAGKAANNTYYSYPAYKVDSDDSIVKNFVSKFNAKYGTAPDVLAAYGFDLMNIALSALENGGNNADNIKVALYDLKNFNGVTGETSFDSNGDVTRPSGIKVIKNENFQWFLNKFN